MQDNTDRAWSPLIGRRVTVMVTSGEDAPAQPLFGYFIGIDDGFAVLADKFDGGAYGGFAMLPLDSIFSITEDTPAKPRS